MGGDLGLVKIAVDGLKSLIKVVGSRLSKKRRAQLISTVVAELLKEHPDLDVAEANMAAAQATGEQPTPELFRARRMLINVKAQTKRKIMKAKAKRKTKAKSRRMIKVKAKRKTKR